MSGVSLSYWISLCFAFAAIGASPVWGRTITVDDDQPADYAAIQPAIQAAVNGDIILVRDGTYKGSQNRALDFAGKAITLRHFTDDQIIAKEDALFQVSSQRRS